MQTESADKRKRPLIWFQIDCAGESCGLAIVFSAAITVTDGGLQSPESTQTASQRLPEWVREGVLQMSEWVGGGGRACARTENEPGLIWPAV